MTLKLGHLILLTLAAVPIGYILTLGVVAVFPDNGTWPILIALAGVWAGIPTLLFIAWWRWISGRP
jgi:hypothetical protein